MTRKTPLEDWNCWKMKGSQEGKLTREQIEQYQVGKLKEVIGRVKKNSRFYKQKLKEIEPGSIQTLADIQRLPFTTSKELTEDPLAFSCVSQQKISRVVSVATSGTTGNPKRVFYTEEDQEATTDFFHFGMTTLACEGDRVLILLPGELPGSVGDLLQKALARMGAVGIKHGPVINPMETLSVMEEERANVIVGLPVHVLSLVRCLNGKTRLPISLKSVLLVSDYVPQAIVRVLEDTWNCCVFSHYGMTETGLGGGVQCEALGGYHMREADLLYEIIDQDTGKPVEDGEYGEVVFSSLTAMGTPLIRYRTGDISRMIPDACPCGTVLKTMDLIKGRILGKLKLMDGTWLELREFDEVLFPIEGVVDFQVSLMEKESMDILRIEIYPANPNSLGDLSNCFEAIEKIPGILQAKTSGNLDISIHIVSRRFNRGVSKRTLIDCREQVVER